MSCSVTQYKDYIEGEKYTKHLTFLKIFGNSNIRYVSFKDEDGSILTWQTNDYTKSYQSLVKRGIYSFKIAYMMVPKYDDVSISISHVKLIEDKRRG